MTRVNLQEMAINNAREDPRGALVFAILDLAQAVRECGTDLEDLVQAHDRQAIETGGIASALVDVTREMAAAA